MPDFFNKEWEVFACKIFWVQVSILRPVLSVKESRQNPFD